jgi:hypothetical protein
VESVEMLPVHLRPRLRIPMTTGYAETSPTRRSLKQMAA